MKTTTTVAALAAFVFGGGAGVLFLSGSASTLRDSAARPTGAANAPQPVWAEIAWPFPLDEWGRGKAFRCQAADCGAEVRVYVRAKIGFCNCATGVADDDELDRLTDFHLIGNHLRAAGTGKPIAVAWMKGRSRGYEIGGDNRSGKSALSVAFNDRCDAIVATAVLQHDRPATMEPGVISLLNSDRVLHWAEKTLGL